MTYIDPDSRYCKSCVYQKKGIFRLNVHTNIREGKKLTTQYFCPNCHQWTYKGTLTLKTIIGHVKAWKAWTDKAAIFLAKKEIYLNEE